MRRYDELMSTKPLRKTCAVAVDIVLLTVRERGPTDPADRSEAFALNKDGLRCLAALSLDEYLPPPPSAN